MEDYMNLDQPIETSAQKTAIRLFSPSVRLLGRGEDNSTACEIFYWYRRQEGQLEGVPLLLIKMMSEIDGFSLAGDSAKFKLMSEFIGGIFDMLLRSDLTSEASQKHIEALRRIIFANELGLGRTKIGEILKWRTIPSARAHAWLWFDLIRRLSPILEPRDRNKDSAGDSIKLREGLPPNHGLVMAAKHHFIRGKVNTAQSIAFRIYCSLMSENNIKTPCAKDVKEELRNFLHYKEIRDAAPEGYIQQLNIEGFDYEAIVGGKGFNITVG